LIDRRIQPGLAGTTRRLMASHNAVRIIRSAAIVARLVRLLDGLPAH
jgi:hypothetical protein